MARARTVPSDYPPFLPLPVRKAAIGEAGASIAVHLRGRLGTDKVPLICIPGYHRNMTDFTEFTAHFAREMGEDWPLILIDLRGRGRSSNRPSPEHYSSLNDANDISDLTTMLGVQQAVLLGQGFGGQVIMALAANRPGLIAGAVLIDAGPITDSRGLVRLRTNLAHIAALKGEAAMTTIFRQVLGADYPGLSSARLDALAMRTHFLGRRGRPSPLYDQALIRNIEDFDLDDLLVAQWPLFDALARSPLLLIRTQLTDQLRRETFDQMIRRRPNAQSHLVSGQGSPALLDQADEVEVITAFLRSVVPAAHRLDMGDTIFVDNDDLPSSLPDDPAAA